MVEREFSPSSVAVVGECRIAAIISPFQGEDAGSTPVTRSKLLLRRMGKLDTRVRLCPSEICTVITGRSPFHSKYIGGFPSPVPRLEFAIFN